MADSLKTLYMEKAVPKLTEQFGYTNPHQIPKLAKITVNRGLGEASQNAKALESSQIFVKLRTLVDRKSTRLNSSH